jgi:hypothetical protein
VPTVKALLGSKSHFKSEDRFLAKRDNSSCCIHCHEFAFGIFDPNSSVREGSTVERSPCGHYHEGECLKCSQILEFGDDLQSLVKKYEDVLEKKLSDAERDANNADEIGNINNVENMDSNEGIITGNRAGEDSGDGDGNGMDSNEGVNTSNRAGEDSGDGDGNGMDSNEGVNTGNRAGEDSGDGCVPFRKPKHQRISNSNIIPNLPKSPHRSKKDRQRQYHVNLSPKNNTAITTLGEDGTGIETDNGIRNEADVRNPVDRVVDESVTETAPDTGIRPQSGMTRVGACKIAKLIILANVISLIASVRALNIPYHKKGIGTTLAMLHD